jgi:hypothetical protein
MLKKQFTVSSSELIAIAAMGFALITLVTMVVVAIVNFTELA